MEYLGCVHPSGQLTDRDDAACGEYDQGRGLVKDLMGSVLAEVNAEGVVRGNANMTAGYLEGFSFVQVPTFAAYVLLHDRPYVVGY